jgi:non-canonical purine NTP pyrophosphatase (RdgB/HAM1 family)
MIIYLLTKNMDKMKAANDVFGKYGIRTRSIEKEYPEIQAESSMEIARYAAQEAARKLQAPVIREDHSLFIHALGIPGPYTGYIEKRLPAEKLLALMEHESDRTGHFELALAYAEPDGFLQEFAYSVPIRIKESAERKDSRNGWSSILCLALESRAFSEYPSEERTDIWNKNYISVAEFLKNREASMRSAKIKRG